MKKIALLGLSCFIFAQSVHALEPLKISCRTDGEKLEVEDSNLSVYVKIESSKTDSGAAALLYSVMMSENDEEKFFDGMMLNIDIRISMPTELLISAKNVLVPGVGVLSYELKVSKESKKGQMKIFWPNAPETEAEVVAITCKF